jgi:hypothetical protein
VVITTTYPVASDGRSERTMWLPVRGELAAEIGPLPPSETVACWAELLKRTFGVDVLECPTCKGRMKLLAVVTKPKSIERILRHLGEPTEPPTRAPARDLPSGRAACCAVARSTSLEGGLRRGRGKAAVRSQRPDDTEGGPRIGHSASLCRRRRWGWATRTARDRSSTRRVDEGFPRESGLNDLRPAGIRLE